MSNGWSDDEVTILMTAYVDLLRGELSGTPLSKAEHNRRVQAATGRSGPAVEFKFCNLSAVMLTLGYPYIDGYKPRVNFQSSMVSLAESFMADKGLPRLPQAERPTLAHVRSTIAAREAPVATESGVAPHVPWMSLRRLWDVATGGTQVAAAPGQRLDLLATGPAAPGTSEALAWFRRRLDDPTSGQAMLFLVGGPGAGKSHTAATLVQDLEPLDEHETLARRRYDYATGHSTLTVINDATIPSEESAASVSADIDSALEQGAHLFACVNRGILVQDQQGTTGYAQLTTGGQVVQWLINKGQETDGESGIVRGRTTDEGADIVVVYLDVCSLFEPRPDVEVSDSDDHPGVEVEALLPVRLHQRDTLEVDRVPGLKLISKAMRTLGRDLDDLHPEGVLHANLSNVLDEKFQRSLVTMLRCSELQSGQYFTYRELWGAISRAVLGSLPREGDVDKARVWDQQRRDADPQKEWQALKEQASYRWPQALFDSSGTAVRTGRDPVGRLTLPADPARDARPGQFNRQDPQSGWATPVLDAFASQEEHRSPLTSLLQLPDTDPFRSIVRPFDERIDEAYIALAYSNHVRSDRARAELGAWYGGYLTRLYAAAHGITAFMPAIALWLEAWHMGPGLPHQLETRLRSLLRPRFNPDDPQSPSLLPLFDAKTRPVTGRSPSPRLALRMDNADLKVTAVGNGLRVTIIEQARDVVQIDLDFPLVREALACSDRGHEGLTDLTPAVSPRLERIRSAHLTAENLSESARISVALEDHLFQIGFHR